MARRTTSHEFAVIGLGRFGTSVALTLIQHGFSVLGIDRDAAIVQRLADQLTQTVAFDTTDETLLRSVDIASFNTVIVAIGSNFESNLLTTVSLRNLGVRTVICKATTERQESILVKIGADRVVLPEHDAGKRLAQEFISPEIVNRQMLGPEHSFGELRVPASLVGRTLIQSDVRRRFGINVIAIKSRNGLFVSPESDYAFQSDDILVVVATNNNLNTFSNLP